MHRAPFPDKPATGVTALTQSPFPVIFLPTTREPSLPPLTSPRSTPRLDALIDELRTALDERGAKVELARLLEHEAGISHQSSKNRISRILGRQMLPNGEDTLLFREFLDAKSRS